MEAATHLLVVDQDPAVRKCIVDCTASAGIVWSEAATAREAMEAVARRLPELVVLDTDLPDVSGLGLARMIRETPGLAGVPIVAVSERASEVDRILAFEMGVDDFLAKPFYRRELAARIQAILRRNRPRGSPGGTGERWASRRVRVDPASARVEVDGEPVELTVSEFRILATLVRRAGRVVGRREFIDALRGPGAPQSERAVDAHVKGIRRKLGPARNALQTVRGVGYRFDDSVPEKTATARTTARAGGGAAAVTRPGRGGPSRSGT